tara:strand:- start:1120 stop:1719 length:600 start_codon:yes stop_codon:yes gene_type:complete
MSIRVLKAKAQSRRLVTKKNSVAPLPVNLYYSRSGGLCCPTRHHEPNPAGGIFVPKAPAPQKSYGNYNRQALLGYSGLANRVVSLKNSQTNAIISNEPTGVPERNTYKRMPEFSQSQRVYNLRSCVNRRKDAQSKCNPVDPICFNDEKGCGKTKISITKDIGYLSASQYLQKKVARRVKDVTKPYELPLAPSGNGTLTC